ncbi:MAG: late competence development ComFB family protein [Chromatiales bacterium]|nr:late competence development ComFB family protein [Gammaproteobacteria bacterium]MBW6477256.1 late competence development ComFB family protein [Chromatiales bacterium]
MEIGSIHNYYESLVSEYLLEDALKGEQMDQDFIEDVACLALNRLPARYVRHAVDMAFFLTTPERERMQQRVVEAVREAIQQVHNGQRDS